MNKRSWTTFHHKIMNKFCSCSYDENLFMIIWWKLVHDLTMKTCSWTYDENLFMILWWKLVHDHLFIILGWKLVHDYIVRRYCTVNEKNINYIGWFMVFNATFNNISVILWRSVLLIEETGGPIEVSDKLYHIMLHQWQSENLVGNVIWANLLKMFL
jgi:hypothetical protein